MAKQQNQKLRILCLMEYLNLNTDEHHPVSAREIMEYLEGQDMPVERKTLYDDLETLRRFGLDVVAIRHGNQTGYHIGQRPFQLPELKLLVDSVQSSRFITRKKSLELIDKLERLTSRHEAKRLHREVLVARRIKTMNESIYYIVDEVQSAIGEDRHISFQYYDYDVSRRRVFRHGGARYTVSPYALMWDDENYYLLAYDDAAGHMKHYRVDKMANLRQENGPRTGKAAFEALDMAEYSNSHFGMFSGSTVPVTLEFRNRLAGPVIDRFGQDVILVPRENGVFTVTVQAAVNPLFFGWLCGFGDAVRILAPESVKKAMAEHLQSIAALYGEEEP